MNKRVSRVVGPAAAGIAVLAVAVGGSYFVGPRNERAGVASAAPYPFVIVQEDGLHIGSNVVEMPAGLLWADVSGNSLLMMTADAESPGSFATVSKAALDGTGVTQLATGVVGVPLVNAAASTVTVLTRQSLDNAEPTIKKLAIDTGALLDQIVAPVDTMLNTLKPNGQALLVSGVDELLWNTIQDLLQVLGEPGAVASNTFVTSATSTLEFHQDVGSETSYLVARPSGTKGRTFPGRLDGHIVGDQLVLWDVDGNTIAKTSAADTADSLHPAPLPAGFLMVMGWHGDNFLVEVSDTEPTMGEEQAGTTSYYDCDAVAWACSQVGSPVANIKAAPILGSTMPWQLKAKLVLDHGPLGAPDGLPESE